MSKVTEFVALYRDLVVEFGQEELPEWALPNAEVIQRMATSLFIHENPAPYRGGGARPAGASPSDPVIAKTITGILEDKSVKPLEGGGTKYGVKIDGVWYSCFKTEVFKGKIFIKGTKVKAVVQPSKDGKYWNLLSIDHVDGSLEEEPMDIPF